MHHTVVDRCADACGERPSVWIREPLESGYGVMVAYELIGHLVQLEGRNSRFDMFCQFAKRFTNKLVGLAHQLNLVFSLQKYLHRRLISRHATTVDTTGIEQTIIMAHQEVTLNLLERVEHHTNENQQ